MRRLMAAAFGFLLVVTMIGSTSTSLFAATKTVAGKVTAVSADSITVSGKDGEVKLVVDTKTDVVGRGIGTKSAELKTEKKPTQIVDFVKTGDEVTAKYDDATKHADEVRVTKPAKPEPPKK